MNQTYTMDETMAEYRQKFYNVYHHTIVPIFREFEAKRKTTLMSVIVVSGLLLFLGGIIAFDVFGNAATTSEFILMFKLIMLLIVIVAAVAIPIHFNKRFIADLKYSCMDKILSLFGHVHWYNETEVISDTELDESSLFSVFNCREAYDGFSGVYKDVPFQISETFMQHITGSGKNRRVVTVFKGVVIKFRANKDIRNKTIVATKGDKNIKGGLAFAGCYTLCGLVISVISDCLRHGFNMITLFSWIILGLIILGAYFLLTKLPLSRNNEILNEIKLEDPGFNKKYKAYSSDQIEGRYLITPAFMERFKNIQTAFGAKNVKCSFYRYKFSGNNLMFAISTYKNLFEIGNLFYSLNNPKQLQTFFNELTSIFLLIDYFKLDEETGL